jgi:hypothetical protein
MANGNRELEEKQPIQNEKVREPYVKPAFRFEQVFVTTALSCGKIGHTDFLCKSNGSAS